MKLSLRAAITGRKSKTGPKAGMFSVVAGKRGSLAKFGTPLADAKCQGQCTCRCCK